jgi:Flp pilus assembly protein TadD
LHHQPHLLASWDHAIEVVNQYALVAPALLICVGIVPFAADLRDRTDVLLLLAALPLVAFTLVFNPEIGAFRDWDAFALPAVPLSVLVGRWICRVFRKSNARGQAVWVVVLVSIVHSLLWVGVNADVDASERRFDVLLREAGNSRHAQAYGSESLAGHYRERGRLMEALSAFEAASRSDPRNGRYHVGRAYVLNLMGDPASAEAALKESLVLSPDRLEAMINLGKLYLETGRLADARSVLARAVNRNRRSTLAIHSLGMVAYRSGDYETAEGLFRRAQELDPANVTYRVDLGTALQFRGELGEAEGVLREALEMEPGNLRARMNLGAVCFQREDYETAAAAFRFIVDRDSSRSDAHLNLGLTYKAMGEATQARTHLKRALELSPDDSEDDQIKDLLDEM